MVAQFVGVPRDADSEHGTTLEVYQPLVDNMLLVIMVMLCYLKAAELAAEDDKCFFVSPMSILQFGCS